MATITYILRSNAGLALQTLFDGVSTASNAFSLDTSATTLNLPSTGSMASGGGVAGDCFTTAAGVPNLTSWAAGNWVATINITTANAGVVIDGMAVYRITTGGGVIGVGQSIGLNIDCGTTGAKTVTVSGSAQTASATDRVQLVIVWKNTNAHGGSKSVSYEVNTAPDTFATPLVLSGNATATPSGVSASASVGSVTGSGSASVAPSGVTSFFQQEGPQRQAPGSVLHPGRALLHRSDRPQPQAQPPCPRLESRLPQASGPRQHRADRLTQPQRLKEQASVLPLASPQPQGMASRPHQSRLSSLLSVLPLPQGMRSFRSPASHSEVRLAPRMRQEQLRHRPWEFPYHPPSQALRPPAMPLPTLSGFRSVRQLGWPRHQAQELTGSHFQPASLRGLSSEKLRPQPKLTPTRSATPVSFSGPIRRED